MTEIPSRPLLCNLILRRYLRQDLYLRKFECFLFCKTLGKWDHAFGRLVLRHYLKLPWIRAVVVAQLVERLLPIPKVRGSNPVIGKKLFLYWTFVYCQLCIEKTKINKKRLGMALLKKNFHELDDTWRLGSEWTRNSCKYFTRLGALV